MYGIYSPYGNRDCTDAALLLADFLATRQIPRLSWLSPTEPATDIDGVWDGRVATGCRFEDWVRTQKTIIWFTVDPVRLAKATKLKCRNVLAIMWNDLQKIDIPMLSRYDLVVVPDRVVQLWLERQAPGVNTIIIPWATILETKRRGRRSTRCPMAVHIRPYTALKYGAFLVDILKSALDAFPVLDVTVAHCRGFDPAGHRALHELLKAKPDRIKEVVRPSRQTRLLIAEQHEWTFLTAVAESAGCLGLESLACGTPLVGYDVPLISTVVRPKQSGWLIPCGIEDSPTEVPHAVPTAFETLDAFREITTSRDLLDDLRGNKWDDLEQRAQRFKDGWAEILRL